MVVQLDNRGPVADVAPELQELSGIRRFLADFAESKISVIGLVLMIMIVLAAIFAPFVTPQNP